MADRRRLPARSTPLAAEALVPARLAGDIRDRESDRIGALLDGKVFGARQRRVVSVASKGLFGPARHTTDA